MDFMTRLFNQINLLILNRLHHEQIRQISIVRWTEGGQVRQVNMIKGSSDIPGTE